METLPSVLLHELHLWLDNKDCNSLLLTCKLVSNDVKSNRYYTTRVRYENIPKNIDYSKILILVTNISVIPSELTALEYIYPTILRQ